MPAAILVDNVTVDFPIYGANRQSLRHTLLARTGGLIRREGGGYVPNKQVIEAFLPVMAETNDS